MGFFSKLFGSGESAATPGPNPEPFPGQDRENGVTFMLLYSGIPQFSFPSLKKRLETAFGTGVQDISGMADEEATLVQIRFGDDEVTVAGLYIPYPDSVLDTILPICHFAAADKEKFRHSKAHILLSCKSTAPAPHVQYDRLYRIAGCLLAEDGGAIGIVNEAAMTAHPAPLIAKTAEERDRLYKEKAMPFMSWLLWTGGCVKYVLDDETIWFVTKGNHQFGLPELAFKGGPKEGNSTMETFNALFAYMYFYRARLLPGHTAEIGGLKLRFSALTEYEELFEGEYGTLVVATM